MHPGTLRTRVYARGTQVKKTDDRSSISNLPFLGGPLMTTGAGQSYELIGVSSWVAGKPGTSCGSKRYPSVFARITDMQDWITETTKDSWESCPRNE